MKVLVLYFSMGGRTEKVAKYIASELEDQVDQIQMERLEYHGKVMELMRKQETIRKGDLSNFSYNKEIEDLSQYDLILFGSPTYGAIPAPVFNGILQHIKNLEGRDVIIFATCRFYGGKILQMMEHDIEKKGGNIIAKKLFKGFFRIKMLKARNFGQELTKMIKN